MIRFHKILHDFLGGLFIFYYFYHPGVQWKVILSVSVAFPLCKDSIPREKLDVLA